MTDRFKEALQTMPDKHAHRIWMWLANNFETIVDALTLATESEQLRKENEELQSKLDKAKDALRFYATGWKCNGADTMPACYEDQGQRARTTLEEI